MSDDKAPSPPFGFPLEGIPLAGTFTAAKLESKHSGLPVKGYQSQSEENVAMVNRSKELEERVLRLVDELKAAGPQKYDQRFIATGMTYLQVAFMLINRGIFQPQRIALPEDSQ
ncbi:hypothetical protein EV128_12567 [Rhizobium azibense]|nr:hypothetical protein EV128_12567 [Rhizobium azibense]